MAKRHRVTRRQPRVSGYASDCFTYNRDDPNNVEVFTPKPRNTHKVGVGTDKDGKLFVKVRL